MKSIFLVLGVVLVSTSWAAGPDLVRVAAQIDSEPKYVAQGSAVSGNCIDIFRAIEKIEPEVKFVGDQQWLPLKRIEAMLAGGKLDVACGLLRNEDRLAAYKVPDTPLFAATYHMVARIDDPIHVRNWDEVRKLEGEGVILVNAGSGAIAALKKAGSLRIDSSAPTTAQNIDKLLAGRGRFYCYRKPGLVADLRRLGYEGRVRILPAPFDSQLFYMVIGAHVAKPTEVRISQALSKLHEHGELKQIAEKWADH